ncbi:hypothetical protein ACR2VI_27295 [Klebsiella pneumoniae]|uniref:Uncharacterized protein n=1 Tax=Aeromonas phage ZPAH14 TaxID=2924887 RepID=A0AAE9GW56_9CAUD|nr:hypothetical protein PP651_gp20 [Aeromonas phage ZPAH14]UOT58059.1 hypothetical protein [Aeromonas phage ZPAH14]
MSPVIMNILKTLGSKMLMLLLEEGIKELKERNDNTVDDKAVAAVRAIRESNVFADDEVKSA